ncbi:MAG: hypothetical protein A2556_00670 [Candidatus Vogelbacteria bacterium RIFOXYD2_FULL_44_9]|uniref:Uncharacterized protein n=1 Tax=Candidatus Vogelbacteria bacterium RIFOXYD2_FULL_44_9 TaxID=1802441 RepID=A0A1G2QSF9_9BACT|nr:MAG: hypothetical protein A2556_00670 [Candidatus Vogelbacteria bacterium RIFOXYD2_FULL_44_9]
MYNKNQSRKKWHGATIRRNLMYEELDPKIVDLLTKGGFVNVTGLLPFGGTSSGGEIQVTDPNDFGRFGSNKGKSVIVTPQGEVWLGTHLPESDILAKLCPRGEGARVPCSNGQYLTTFHLLHRLRDPYCSFGGSYSPKPAYWK